MLVTGIPLDSIGLDGLTILHKDGQKEPLLGFIQWYDESLVDALTRTANEMEASIIFELKECV